MRPAPSPRPSPELRLLHLQPSDGEYQLHGLEALPGLLRAGDLLVVNDAATLPASLRGRTREGSTVELRLLAREEDGRWTGVLFGAGDWRTRTEDRPPPPAVAAGETLYFGALEARVLALLPPSPRLVRVAFSLEGAALWSALYRTGRPVQYAHLTRPLALWDVQTAYAARPWAAELPSAGLPLTWELLLALRRRGVELASVTHAAGLSSTGDPALDAALPRPERFSVPAATVEAIARTKARGGRVVAVGTTVVRALEGRALQGGGRLEPGEGETDVLLGPGFRRQVVDGLLTGVHDPGTSHFLLLQAFAPLALLREAHTWAEGAGLLGHEFGDVCLLLDG
ncbi:S-adenosylmethionine tRNA ribosyltransferase [Aggregicoccus sp. 17bor-14]|uniref:S-adenosylmethionine:tRNA ribosyltransferase-isomerase n=1 Tax=Myxococcaceae TaxID=31 RepID=UPI00129CE0B9|nr:MULTISPECIES: S-adenosylmethionine:tRNA ribosyltransferase-isomerase [Myxococcaceae]MBF5045185.1 S-adenosylmethionine:tRNA ribosyltransferase-isomerase [Simulacricoccus sp. 17bor-14]MRI90926.1 S-adenosylmethionine tRNA ribosyltransferase [Aggregicoccus sp. 17bor-14]